MTGESSGLLQKKKKIDTHTQAVIQENEGQKKLLDIKKTNSKIVQVNSYQKLL